MGRGPENSITTKTLLFYFFVGLSVTFLIMTHGFRGTELGLGWVFLGLAVGLGKRVVGPRIVFIPILLLLLSVILAVPGSILWEDRFTRPTFAHMIWILPFLGLYLIANKEALLQWIIPLLALQSFVVILEGLQEREAFRQQGLLDNPNPAGALLAIGTVYLLTTRFRWLAPFTILGLQFTGSRSALVALILVLVIMGIVWIFKRYKMHWGPIIVTVLLLIPILGLNIGGAGSQFKRGAQPWTIDMITKGISDYSLRLELTQSPSFIPKGITHSWGLHSLPERLSVEFGIIAGICWTFVTIYGLFIRPYFNGSWWILLTIIILSLSEYSVWLGPLAALWWLTLGIRVKGNKLDEGS